MPTAKGKGASTSHRYRPASEYDDATLAQKREYWRNKKREQRARLSERRGKPPAQDRRGKKLLHLNASAATYPALCGSFPALAESLQSGDDSYNSASQSGHAVEDGCALASAESQKWLETTNDNDVLPQLPVSCSVSAEAAGCETAAAALPTARGAVSRAVTSPTSSGTQLNTSSLVPPVRATRITNGSLTTTAPQPCVSMQRAPDPETQHKAQVALPIQPKLGMILASSPLCPASTISEGKTTSTAPQSGAKGASAATQGAKGVAQPEPESEEERAAKRREHWRIKKREQRAKLAARIVKARERAQGVEMTYQRLTSQKAGLAVGRSILLPSQQLARGVARKQCPARVKAAFTSGKRENDKVQCEAASVAMANADQMQHSRGNKITQPGVASDGGVKKPTESHRKLSNYVHLCNVTRGIARCKTPRQRLIEAQKNFTNQRNLRCKSLLVSSSVFTTRAMPKIDPSDTPEQIVAKRREYWRMKKREQRAKLSMEMRVRLKEKDSVMRRVKRYQRILEEMRRARAMTHSPASVLAHASETIGGFIKEDGTLTANIPQGPAEHSVAENMSEEELHIASKYNSIRQQQSQPHTRRRGVAPVRVSQPPPPLRLAQVKVTFPLAGKSVNKPPRLLAIRPRTQLERTSCPTESQTVTLTHPQTLQSAALDEVKQGGCVMKLAVSSREPSPSALSLDPELTEEERMAKKREYWRIKKREQRAARAFRLKQGVLQARAGASLQRRRAQKQAAAAAVQSSRSLPGRAGKAQPLSSDAVTPLANDVKQESESVPEVDLTFQQEQAACEDLNHPTSPSPTPAPPPEFDPALNADSQATTLLAVASMKKLLEESLSTVTECKSEQTDITMDATEEQDMKPNLPQLFFDKDDLVPITADLTLQIKSWQTDSDVSVQADSPNQELRNSPQTGEKSPPLPASDDVVLHPTCEHSSQTPLNFIVNPSVEAFGGSSSSPPATLRVSPKIEDHQSSCSPELPELRHDTTTAYLDQLEPPPPPPHEQHREQQRETEDGSQSGVSPSAQRFHGVATEKTGLTSLQSKREYWKLMKRQQRARLKARHKDRHGDGSGHLSPRNLQGSGLVTINPAKGVSPPTRPALRPKPPIASVATSVPAVLVVNRTTCNADAFRDVHSCESAPASPQLSQAWTPGNADLDPVPSPPSPPTLQPPDNPLSSINLQPIEPPGQSPTAVLSPIKIPCAQRQSPTHVTQPPAGLEPLSNMAPPKPIPGESEEDFLRRKREYWRIKKKEQRARKAIRDKGASARRALNNWRPILPARDLQTQESRQWVNSPEESEHLMSTTVDTDTGSFTYPNYTTPHEDDPEIIFADYESNPGEDGPISDVVWRTRYLMDYDPLNQLLVCMVCGELQYSHGLEGVRAHIDESHPHTLTLEPAEKQRILEAWDEQVSQRERFFTSQLQQHSGALADWRPVQDVPHLSPSDNGDGLQSPATL